jgi:type IV pilus assembly protein PilZ
LTTGRRVHERYERRLKIVVNHGSGKIECVTDNVSLGGMLLVTDASLPYGTPVTLEFYLPALKEHAKLEATVRWGREGSMGVQFGSLRARDVWALNQLFKEEV